MSHNQLVNRQQMLARRSFLQLMASTTLGATLLAACKPITAPSQPLVAAKPPEELNMKLQKVVVNGVELHYLEQGQGDSLVLLHGGLADYREWGPQMDRFA